MIVGKVADRYFKVDPWKVVEEGFDPAHGRVAESVFALVNEYMGVRGYLRSGVLPRSFTWTTHTGKHLQLTFQRALSMVTPMFGGQRIVFEALNFTYPICMGAGLDFSVVHETRDKG